MNGKGLVVLCTCPDEEAARRIAHALVEERLAACVNRIHPVISTYRWEDEVREDGETLLLIKTSQAAYDKLERRLRALHSYELPEIVAVPITGGLPAYLEWVAASCV